VAKKGENREGVKYHVHFSKETDDLVTRAVRITGQNKSEFVRVATLERALEILQTPLKTSRVHEEPPLVEA